MSYKVLDQFETEPNSFYSGSYTDGIYMGSMGDGAGRFLVAAKSSGSVELTYAQNYSDFADYSGSNRNRSLGNNLRFRSFFSTSELYQDTILPDIYYAFLLNGGKPALGYIETVVSQVLVADPAIGVPTGYPVGKLIFTTQGTTASYGFGATNVADGSWFTTFPYQGRYKNVVRNLTSTIYRSNIACPVVETVTELLDGIPRYTANNDYGSSSLGTLEVIIPRSWYHDSATGSAVTEPIRYTLIDVTGSVKPSGSFTETFWGVGLSTSGSYPPSTNGFFDVSKGTKRPNEKQLTRFVFGFGDNYQGVPVVNAVTSSKIFNDVGNLNGYYASSVDIRGWRYGVFNGFAYYSSCVFRSSRYGQFRDMMEQRKTTKFFDPAGLTLDARNNGRREQISSVVLINFISGSNSFISASFPETLNLNDSGIYDFEYKSGQPWRDV